MNKLDYSLSLRAKGLSRQEIIKEMGASGFDESEIKYYLKKSDEIFLNQFLKKKQQPKSQTKTNRVFKTVVLIFSLLLLLAVFYGYATLGIIGLFVFWSLAKFGSYKK